MEVDSVVDESVRPNVTYPLQPRGAKAGNASSTPIRGPVTIRTAAATRIVDLHTLLAAFSWR